MTHTAEFEIGKWARVMNGDNRRVNDIGLIVDSTWEIDSKNRDNDQQILTLWFESDRARLPFDAYELAHVDSQTIGGVVMVVDGEVYLSQDGVFIDWEPKRLLGEYHGKRILLTVTVEEVKPDDRS